MMQPSNLGNSQSMQNMEYAGFWWRFLAVFIDSIILQVISCIIGLGLGIVIGVFMASSGMDQKALELVANLIGSIMGLFLGWLYYALFEASEHQATPGKMVCNIKVVDAEGNGPSFARASGRYWGRILSALTCSAGYIMAAFTAKKQGLHDILAGTYVVKKNG
jgi:uncharacterized RDD family membrane protein YckC